jgi:hypothetical protein
VQILLQKNITLSLKIINIQTVFSEKKFSSSVVISSVLPQSLLFYSKNRHFFHLQKPVSDDCG